MRHTCPLAASLAAIATLAAPAAAPAAVQILDLGPPVSSQPGGFDGRRIGPDGTVAGRTGTSFVTDQRAGIWREGTVTQLASPRYALATDSGEGGVVGYASSPVNAGADAALWGAPSLAPTPIAPPPYTAPSGPGINVEDVWLTADGSIVQTRGEKLDAVIPRPIVTSWIDGAPLVPAAPQGPTSQDPVTVTDVAESGWIVGGYVHLELRLVGSQRVWVELGGGYVVWKGIARVRTFPRTASPSTDFQPSLVDEAGTLYGTRGGVLGRMRADSSTFEPIATPPGVTAFALNAVAGDGVIVGSDLGPDAFGGTADDEAWQKRGDGAWAKIRDRIPTASPARTLTLLPRDVNTSGDILISARPSGQSFVLRSRSRITGTVAAPALPGGALAGARVEVVATGLAGAPTVRTTAGADGRYTLVVPPGRYRIAITGGAGCSVGAGGCSAARELTLDGERDVTLPFRIDAATQPAVPVVRPGAKLAVRRGGVGVRVACRLVTRRCKGTLALLPARGSRALATKKLDLAPGATATVRVMLPAAVRRRIAGRAIIAIRIRATTKIASGRSLATTVKARLD